MSESDFGSDLRGGLGQDGIAVCLIIVCLFQQTQVNFPMQERVNKSSSVFRKSRFSWWSVSLTIRANISRCVLNLCVPGDLNY